MGNSGGIREKNSTTRSGHGSTSLISSFSVLPSGRRNPTQPASLPAMGHGRDDEPSLEEFLFIFSIVPSTLKLNRESSRLGWVAGRAEVLWHSYLYLGTCTVLDSREGSGEGRKRGIWRR